MTASNYMCDVQVEIAFNAGYSTPAASRTWTDVSTYVELSQGIDIGFGRSDELSTADANTLKVVLDNTSGRFTPEYTSGANYPNVKIGRPIRVKSTRVGGSASTRFLGYIDSWAPSPSGANSMVTVTATSQIARLGLDEQFYGSLTGSWADLHALYLLGESASPAVDSMNALADLDTVTGTVTWRGGVGPEGAGTAVRLSDTSSLAYTPPASTIQLPEVAVFEFFFAASTLDEAHVDAGQAFVTIKALGGNLFVDCEWGNGAAVSYTGGALPQTDLHHLAMVRDATSLTLYFDGVEVDSDVAVTAGEAYRYVHAPALDSTNSTIDLSYVAFSGDVAGIPARSLTVTVAFNPGATASERIEFYATYAGVESTDVDATTEILTAYSPHGKTMLESMRAAELSDGGVLYDSASGALTYNDRESRYSSTSSFTLSAATQQIEASVAPKLDRAGLINEANVSQTEAEGVLARATDDDSIADYGVARSAWEIQGAYDACLQAASWAVFIHGEPETRIPNLEVDFLPLSTALQDSLFAATIGTRFTVTGLPTDFPASTIDFFLEGYTETIGPESYRFSLNVSQRDSAKWDVWTVEDATYGQYDAYPIAW